MKVLVCGSRYFDNYELLKVTLAKLDISEIIHGGARGADTLAGCYGEEIGVDVRRYPALWDLHGKRAGPIRNHQMLREGNPDHVVAFLAPNSRGTKHMIEISQRANIPVEIINI